MKTKILKVKGDWQEVVDDCRTTVKKPPLGKEPSESFKRNILIAEHSPIRDITVKFEWKNIPYWVAMHWKTHKWESRTSSQRNDRQSNYDREKAPQDAPVDFVGEPNAQHQIDTWRKRLCWQASEKTRKYAEDYKITLHSVEPELSDTLVPNCVYRCGCPEMASCPYKKTHGLSYWQHLVIDGGQGICTDNIANRYAAYNKIFWKENKRHGHWFDVGVSARCSCCGCKSDREYDECPVCHAIMDEVTDNAAD